MSRCSGTVLCALALAVIGCESHPKVDWAGDLLEPRAPAAPAGVSLEPDHESVTVTWEPNAETDGVVAYVVYSASESWQTWDSGLPDAQRTPDLPCCAFNRMGLPNEASHWFSVAAVNATGEGGAAPPLEVVPPGWEGSLQNGTAASEFASSISAGVNGDLVTAGSTYGDLGGESSHGGMDGYVVRYRTSGKMIWTRLVGTPADDGVTAVAADALGNVYLAGQTDGAFPGEMPKGLHDVYVAKLDPNGMIAWLHQIGTAAEENIGGIALHGTGALCVVGSTGGDLDGELNAGGMDAFVTLYDSTGTRQWTKLVGTTAEELGNAATFGGEGSQRCFAAGTTSGALQGSNLGGKDGFVAEYLPSGGQTWIRQFGATNDQRALGVASDELRDRVYVSGDTLASFGGQVLSGSSDPFIVAYDRSAGTIDWTRFVGGDSLDYPAELSLLSDGSVVAAYYAFQSVTQTDVVVVRVDSSGAPAWTTAVGTGSLDYFGGLTTDSYLNTYVTGYTMGSLGATSAGDWDYFVAKIGPDGIVR